MSRTNGQLVKCDRCGKTVFLACTGEGEADGGYTRWNKFEPLPDGWEFHYDVGLLCACCGEKWSTLVRKFKYLEADH